MRSLSLRSAWYAVRNAISSTRTTANGCSGVGLWSRCFPANIRARACISPTASSSRSAMSPGSAAYRPYRSNRARPAGSDTAQVRSEAVRDTFGPRGEVGGRLPGHEPDGYAVGTAGDLDPAEHGDDDAAPVGRGKAGNRHD